ncbi:MAG: site-specific integrase [Bacteroidales bacterium]|nr:site-specific integrase [Bacteroidales bacterium]
MKQIVKLRVKKLAKGQGSYYLDWHIDGQRHYEYLQLYIDLAHNDRETTARNKEIERIAMQLRNKKEDDIIYGGSGVRRPIEKNSDTIDDYIDRLTQNPHTQLFRKHMRELFPDMPMCKLAPRHIHQYLDYTRGYSPSTRKIQITYFKAIISKANNDDILPHSLLAEFPDIRVPVKPVTYLTPDEIRLIRDYPWVNDDNRRSFIFSCLTGLRYSDVKKLTWAEITHDFHIQFSQQKTQISKDGNAYAFTRLPLNEQAMQLIGERRADNSLVFPRMSNPPAFNKQLKIVARKVGINKNVHFHMARHSCGVMLANKGVDIYTISKLLGHRKIETTVKFYANINDEHARESINKLPII